jgi:hypothetical protein
MEYYRFHEGDWMDSQSHALKFQEYRESTLDALSILGQAFVLTDGYAGRSWLSNTAKHLQRSVY